MFVDPSAITWQQIFESLTFGGTIITNGWYLQVALVLYVIFYIVYMLPKINKAKPWIASMLCIFLLIVMYLFKFDSYWYMSLIAFPLGLLWASYQYKIDSISNRIHIFLCLCDFVCFCYLFVCKYFISTGFFVKLLTPLCALSFVIFVVELIKFIPISCKPTIYLGKISLEIYVLQGLLLGILKIGIIGNLDLPVKALISIGIFIGVILLSSLIHPFIEFVNNAVSGKRKVSSL